MTSIAKTTLIISFAIVALPLLLFGGMMTSTFIAEGMSATRALSGIEWVGLPALTMGVIGTLMIWALFGQQNLDELPSSSKGTGLVRMNPELVSGCGDTVPNQYVCKYLSQL